MTMSQNPLLKTIMTPGKLKLRIRKLSFWELSAVERAHILEHVHQLYTSGDKIELLHHVTVSDDPGLSLYFDAKIPRQMEIALPSFSPDRCRKSGTSVDPEGN